MNGPVRFSHLKAYGRSAMHGQHARQGGEDEETYAMERGTAVHALLFGTRKVTGYPGAVRRGKEYDAFVAAHPDHEILTAAEYIKARCMADAVLASELAKPLLDGVVEQTRLFRWMGQDCRSTPDVRGPNFITELKTTANADPQRFVWDALKRGYHAQMRFEQLACQANGYFVDDCYVVAVESTEPFPVTVFRIRERALEVGEKLLMTWMERLNNCERSGVFPPYAQTMCEIDVPDDEAIELEEEVA